IVLNLRSVEDVYNPGHIKESMHVFGTDAPRTPVVSYLRNKLHTFYIGRNVCCSSVWCSELDLPLDTPAKLRSHFKRLAWCKVVLFQTRKPIPHMHRDLTVHAARQCHAVCPLLACDIYV
ncbi:hypothetical protein DFH07DRAFT_746136, partial [Mycena maculata]